MLTLLSAFFLTMPDVRGESLKRKGVESNLKTRMEMTLILISSLALVFAGLLQNLHHNAARSVLDKNVQRKVVQWRSS